MASGQVLLSLAPVYDYLQTHGGKLEGEYIVLDGWPVQFLPPADALDQELFSRPMNMGDVSRALGCHRAANWSPEGSRENSAVY